MTVFIFTTNILANPICRVARHYVGCSDVGLAINTVYARYSIYDLAHSASYILLNIVDRLVLAGDGARIRLQSMIVI